ncbi:MAG: RHS repeat-associated core domain-containing protein [Chloroflexi bacterium]|nr:RHS repeat-associated core domain-containing protein [Chloroflexota bacterium]
MTLRWRGAGMVDLGIIATWTSSSPYTVPAMRTAYAVAPAGAIAVEYSMQIYIWQVSHEVIDEGYIPPLPDSQLYGLCTTGLVSCTTRYEAEPVNTALGNYLSEVTDVALPGRGLGFAFRRTYNSLDTGSGVLGPGWRHAYEARLVINPDSSVRLYAEDGAQLLFTPNGQGGFTAPPGALSRLAPIAGGYELTGRDQVRDRFDAAGLLTAILDRNANQLTMGYSSGRLSQVTDTVGRAVTLTYDANGRLTGLAGPPSRSVTYGYDANGRLNSVTDVRSKVWTYTYDAGGRLATIVDPNLHTVVTNEYGANGRVSAQTDARGKRATFAWDATTQTSTFTDANGGKWVDAYSRNVLMRSVDPLGNTTRYGYDSNASVTTITNPRNLTTQLTYDTAGNLLTRTAPSPLSYVETWTYTALNDVATYTDGRTNQTTYTYDAAGNLITVGAPLGAITQYGRDPAGTGLLVTTTDPRGKTTTYAYDSQANLNLITTPLGNKTTMSYDAAGRLLTMVEPRGNVVGGDPAQYTTSFTYNLADHPLTVTDPLRDVTTRTYDDAGNLLTVTDANNHPITYAYDAANHLSSVTDAAGKTTAYTYDNVANLKTRLDANQHTTTNGYDLANRLTSNTDPASHVWLLTYDPAGNLATRRDANLKTTTYAYDALNRPTSITYATTSTPTVTFAYDANSNRTAMTDGAGTESYTFDALNRPTAVTRGSDTFSDGYDLAGNVISRTYPGQSAQTWVYDDDGRLMTANGAAYTYDPAANLLTAATPDGLTARYTYDRAGRLLEVAHSTVSDTLSRFSYGLDPVGNRTAMTTREGTVTYRYDAVDRLSEACWSSTSCPGGVPASPLPCLACIGGLLSRPAATVNPPPGETYRTYTYDPVGNRLTEGSNAGSTTYLYDVADRLTSVTPPGQSAISYAFDANGNQTSAGATTYTYDLADLLKTATVGAVTETYAYAGDGTRLSGSTGGGASQTTKFLWDRTFGLPQLAIERDGSDALLRSYSYGLDLLRQTAGSTAYYYHADALGSVTDITSSSGSSLTWGEHYPFGLVRQAGSGAGAPTGQPFNFAGEQLDAVTGLYHLRARQYDPSIGRFLTTDPVAGRAADPYSSNYSYAGNNPILFADPSGRCFGPLIFLLPECISAAVGVLGYLAANTAQNGIDNLVHHRPVTDDLSRGINPADAVIGGAAGVVSGPISAARLLSVRLLAGAAAGCLASYASQELGGRQGDRNETRIGCAGGAVSAAVPIPSALKSALFGMSVSIAQALATYFEQRISNANANNAGK